MSKDALKRAALVLAVLVVGWGAFALFRGDLSDEPVGFTLPTVPAGDVTRIEIQSPDDTLTLALGPAGRWTVNARPASQAALDETFEALADTAYATELVARNPASHERLGVDTAGGRHVVFLSGDEVLLDLWVGDTGRDFQSRYLRLEGDSAVYLFRGRLANLLARGMDAWRDRQIASVTPDSVGAISWVHPAEGAHTVRRTGGGWQMGGAAADSSEMDRWLDELTNLRAAAFPTPAQEDSITFASPYRRLTAIGRGGDTLLALVFDSTEAGVWVRHDSGGVVWRIDQWRAERITPPESLLTVRR